MFGLAMNRNSDSPRIAANGGPPNLTAMGKGQASADEDQPEAIREWVGPDRGGEEERRGREGQ